MRSEKEIRERIEALKEMDKRNWAVSKEIDELEWVLADDKEAVVCPLLADLRAELQKISALCNDIYFDENNENVVDKKVSQVFSMIEKLKDKVSEHFS